MKKKQELKLSYESDGKMGKERKSYKQTLKQQEKEFFNTTQNSE